MSLRAVCTWALAGSFLFFGATFLTRFACARSDRRATMAALLYTMVPVHLVFGAALAALPLWGATTTFLIAMPALTLTPLATVYALIRHDLWGSRTLLSRVLTRAVIVAITTGLAVVLGTIAGSFFRVPLSGALLTAAVAGTVAGLLIQPALDFGDRALFPARAVYKPTIEQLSNELTVLTVPEKVGEAVERTVRRWLPCEQVALPADGSAQEARKRRFRGYQRCAPASRGSDPPLSTAHKPQLNPEDHDEISLDVVFEGVCIAVLSVGKKRGGALFTTDDIDLLRTIANQAALALAHAYSYAELELRRQQQAAAWRGEREALIETVAAEVAHEVRYPINYFRSLFKRGQGAIELDAEEIDIGCEEVERLERLVSGLRRVAVHKLDRQSVPVRDLVIKTQRLLRDVLGGRRLVVSIAGTAAVQCDADQITQVLVNLVSNAH